MKEIKLVVRLSKQGHKDAIEMGLHKKIGNWTPLLIYIHTSRLLAGLALGIPLGFIFGVIFSLIVFS